jgi:hypothetical protein
MATALDDRTFETAESVAAQLTPEDLENSRQHFADKGYEITVDDEGATPPAEPEPTHEEPPPVEVQPVETPVATVEHPDVDEESQREYQATQSQPDGEKLGRWAKKNKLIREQAQELATIKGQLEEARRQAERGNTPSGPTAPAAVASPFVPPAPAAVPEAPAKKFEKPEPKLPVFEDFVNDDDPLKAHANAIGQYAKDVIQYERDRQNFENEQSRTVQQQSFAEQKANETRQTKLAAAQQAYPDFMDVIKPQGKDVQYGEVLQYLLRDELEDGFELGYQLARPENAEFFNKLRNDVAVTKGEDPQSVGRKITRASGELAVFRHELKKKTATPAPTSPAPAPAATPVATAPKQTPPVALPPRREEAAPTPIRGNGAPAQRLEDIDPMDSDARRAFKRANGLM